MLNLRSAQKASFTNKSQHKRKSIYRGDHSHTVSMHLKIDCDLTP